MAAAVVAPAAAVVVVVVEEEERMDDEVENGEVEEDGKEVAAANARTGSKARLASGFATSGTKRACILRCAGAPGRFTYCRGLGMLLDGGRRNVRPWRTPWGIKTTGLSPIRDQI